MLTTRRQSKSIEPPALPPVAPPKRKRKDDTTAPSVTQPPNQPSSKRRKKVKSTARVDTPIAVTSSAPAAPAAKRVKPGNNDGSKDRRARKQGKELDPDISQPKPNGTASNGSRQSAKVDLTAGDDDDLGENDTTRRSQPAPTQDADDDDADSRYALGSKRGQKKKRRMPPYAQRTAELRFEEDGLEEIDKADAVVANTNYRTSSVSDNRKPLLRSPANAVDAGKPHKEVAHQMSGYGKNKVKERAVALPGGAPSKVVMFTIVEAIAALSLYQGGTMSIPAEVDPQSRQPYEPIQTGEYLSYPVKGNYHLGALGRYGINIVPPLPFSLTVPLSEYSFIQHTQHMSAAEPSRHGLGFDGALSPRPKVSSIRRPNNYCFTFGKYRGRRMDSVPIDYLRSIFNSDDYHNDTKMQRAFEDLYPKGLYESEAESYTFEKGGFKGKRLDEVPKSYLWGLVRKVREEGLPKKGKGRLERALDVWEKAQLDFTKD